MCRVLSQMRVRSTVSEEELNSTLHALLQLVLALQRALPAEVQVQSSLVALLSTLQQQASLSALPAAGQLLGPSLSTHEWSTRRRLSERSLLADRSIAQWLLSRSLSTDWSTLPSLSSLSLSTDWSTAHSLSTRSQSADRSTVDQRLAESVQTVETHQAALSDVGFRRTLLSDS